MNNIGHAWYKKGDNHQALCWFDSALAVQQQEPALEDQMANTINNKGVLLMANAQWKPALIAFQHSVEIMTRLEYHDELASILGNMGLIKDQLGEYEAALDLYRRVGEAQKAAGIHNYHSCVADNLMNMAFVYMNQARWKEALQTLHKVKEIRERILPVSHVDMGRTWFTMGLVLRSQEHLEEAHEHMRRALVIYEQSLERGHPHIANAYNSMGNIKSVQGHFENALPLYERAKEQFQQFYDTEEHPDIARVFNNMGQAYRLLGNFSEACKYLNKALDLRQITLGSQHPDTATTWVNLALAYRAHGDLNTALGYANRGLSIRRSKLRPEHEDLKETEEFVVQLEQEIFRLQQQPVNVVAGPGFSTGSSSALLNS